MGDRKSEKATLVYPTHQLDPEEVMDFIQATAFKNRWKALGLTKQDMRALEIMIMCDPKGGNVISGTGGLRKLRFSPAKWRGGKSSGLRVCYVHFEEYCIVLFTFVYKKSEMKNLPGALKKEFKKFIAHQKAKLREGPIS